MCLEIVPLHVVGLTVLNHNELESDCELIRQMAEFGTPSHSGMHGVSERHLTDFQMTKLASLYTVPLPTP